MIAVVPARAGSKRIPGKNTRELGGKPLISWTTEAALELFPPAKIWICSDDQTILTAAKTQDLSTWERPPVPDDQKDVEWIQDFLEDTWFDDDLLLLRPTSPFRGPSTIRRALYLWERWGDRWDSLRTVRKATESAWKQWVIEDEWHNQESCPGSHPEFLPGTPCPHEDHKVRTMTPLTTAAGKKHLHSFPTQCLTPSYIQTAGLEILKPEVIKRTGTIAGDQVGMFLVEGWEALDINEESDFTMADLHAHQLVNFPPDSMEGRILRR